MRYQKAAINLDFWLYSIVFCFSATNKCKVLFEKKTTSVVWKKIFTPLIAVLVLDWWICVYHNWLCSLGRNVLWDSLFNTHSVHLWTFPAGIQLFRPTDINSQESSEYSDLKTVKTAELQKRGGIEDNSEIIFLSFERKNMLWLSLEL